MVIQLFAPRSFPGVRACMEHLSKTCDGTKLIDERDPISISDPIILGGWSKTYQHIVQQHKAPVAVYWCSTIGQTELSQVEVPMLSDVLDHPKISRLFMSHWAGAQWAKRSGVKKFSKVRWLPCTVSKDLFLNPETFSYVGGEFRVDLSVPVHPRKNILNQVLACQGIGIPYVHELPHEYSGFKQYVKERPWEDRQKYRQHITSCHAGLQVSWTESFNYAFAERLLIGLPTVTDMQTLSNHMPGRSKDAVERDAKRGEWMRWFNVRNPDNVGEIAEKLSYIKNDYPEALRQWASLRDAAIERYVQNAKIAAKALQQWISG